MSESFKHKHRDDPKESGLTTKFSDPQNHEDSPPLTQELLASYQDSHYRLLLLLCLILAFVLACFPVSDPDIYYSLQVGKLITSGEFPWGIDPFGFAQGTNANWVHHGWLGDLVIYGLYQTGGGPVLILVRAVLITLMFWLLLQTGKSHTIHLRSVLIVFLGIVVLSQRLYFRTELFSLIMLGVTCWIINCQMSDTSLSSRLVRWVKNSFVWLLPVVFLLWVNLDSWYFLGLVVLLCWCGTIWLQAKHTPSSQRRSIILATVLSLGACLCSPYHVKGLMHIPAQLWPAAATELHERFVEQKKQNEKTRMPEHLRLFASPWSGDFFQIQRAENIANLSFQAPLLPLCYPLGLSIAEWTYYPFLLIVILGLVTSWRSGSWMVATCLVVFAALSCWQSRFIGFFSVVAVGFSLASLNTQTNSLPSLNRLAVLAGQLACLLIGLSIQLLSVLHLIPTPDYAPSALGHVHPRGSFGFSFRSDTAIGRACQEMNRWHLTHQLAGNPYHLDWIDVAAYDVWFNPGSRHFFDTRFPIFSRQVANDYFTAREALLGVITSKDARNDKGKSLERQSKWQTIFAKYDISYVVLKRRGQYLGELVAALLRERDQNNLPVWKPLQLHNGQVYALAWVGSPHWKMLQKLEFNAGETSFRKSRRPTERKVHSTSKDSLTQYLLADPVRRPAALDESDWYVLQNLAEYYTPGENLEPLAGKLERYGGQQMLLTSTMLGARLAAVPNPIPFVPLWLSYRQSSASSLFLSLTAARRAFVEFEPGTSSMYRFESCLQYMQAINALSEYEQGFTQASMPFREPLRIFVLRQAALAALESGHNSAIKLNQQLTRIYINNGSLDAAWEHYRLARDLVERSQADQVEANIKKLESSCKQEFGFSPEDLQNELKRRLESWQRDAQKAGWITPEGQPVQFALNRAVRAVQYGLPKKALDELLGSGLKSIDISVLACDIYSRLGQHDIVWQEFVQKSPDLKAALKPMQLHKLGAMGEWCLGHPELAAQHRLAYAQLIDQSASRASLYGSQLELFGTSTRGISNVFEGQQLMEEAMSMSFELADHTIAAGMLLLEAGEPQQAAKYFKEAVERIEPNTPWRPLIERYYQQITGDDLK